MNCEFKEQPKFWNQKNIYSFLLLPFSFLYIFIIKIRKFFYSRKFFTTTTFEEPIIVVGNVTVGGVGKTPLVMWLANFLKEQGFNPGIVSMGYGGKKNNQPFEVMPTSDVSDVGDEALMIARRTKCPMVIAKNRVAAVRKLLESNDCNIIISDDGLQHYALARDLEIIVIDGDRFFGNGYCLPAGPLREPINRLKTVDFIVVNSTNNTTENSYEHSMKLVPDSFCNIKHEHLKKNSNDFFGSEIHAVAGIGNPERFFNSLKKMGLSIIEHPFPDHYSYKCEDFAFAANKIIIMTEKDAVKCEQFANDNWWYLPVTAKLDNSFVEKLKQHFC